MIHPRRATALLVVSLLLAACHVPAPAATPVTTPAKNATATPLLPVTTDELPNLDTGQFAELLTQLRGTPVVVNYWASWCSPCKAEMPLLAAAARKYGAKIQFLGVDVLDGRNGAIGFLRAYGVPYPSLFDPAGDLANAIGLLGPPGTFFYDAEGSLVTTVPGQLTSTSLQQGLASISG